MHYPQIDPIIVSLGPVALRWYGLMYLLGFAAVWWLGHRRATTQQPHWSDNELSDMVFYGAMGAVLGGRIGYVLFYNFSALATDPLYLLRIWEGGMAFHGGLLGVLVAMLLFARKTHRSFISITDFLAPLCPIGLGLGRLGNFINMELPGRVSESGFGLVYPCEVVYAISPMCVGTWESAVRHPSSLYQAFSKARCCLPCYGWCRVNPDQQVLCRRYFFAVMAVFVCLPSCFASPMRTSALSYLVVSVWASCCRCRCLSLVFCWASGRCKMRARRQLRNRVLEPLITVSKVSQQSYAAVFRPHASRS